jgi:type II secretory pathway pseudopilin PulG
MNAFIRKIFRKTSMTLTELIVASAIVGIVMLGVISIDYAVRSSKKNISETSLMVMQTSAAMHQITRDAMRVVGDHSSDANRGISWDAVGDIQNICFRYDADNDPNDYTNDLWTCFSLDARSWAAHRNTLYRCTDRGTALAADITCEIAGDPQIQILPWAQTNFFTVNQTGSLIDSIGIDLLTRVRPTAAANVITNPEYRLQSIISPPGLSR